MANRVLTWFLVAMKSSKLLVALKAVKSTKVLISMGTLLVSAIVYALTMGPWFAIGLIMALVIHEMGHVIALKMRGYEAKAPIFIPMIGAVIFAPKMRTGIDEAIVGLGGPLLGTLSTIAILAIWMVLGANNDILLMIGYIATFLNLFNLIPIRPLDGGRITVPVGAWFKYLGAAILLIICFFVREPVMLYVWILVLSDYMDKQRMVRAMIATVCLIVMTVLMIMGFGHQPMWVNILDIVVATALVGGYWVAARNPEIEFGEERYPEEPMAVKIKWLAIFAGITLVLIGLMALQVPFIEEVLSSAKN